MARSLACIDRVRVGCFIYTRILRLFPRTFRVCLGAVVNLQHCDCAWSKYRAVRARDTAAPRVIRNEGDDWSGVCAVIFFLFCGHAMHISWSCGVRALRCRIETAIVSCLL